MGSYTTTRRGLLAAMLSGSVLQSLGTATATSSATATGTQASGTEWRMFQADKAATGSVTSVSGPAASDIKQQWSTNLNFPTSPVFTEDQIFAVGQGVAYALDRETGAGKWRTEVASGDHYAPALGHGQLYLAGGNSLFALDQGTGEIQWKIGEYYGANFLVHGDSVYTHQHRIDPANGDILTTYGDFSSFSAPCIADGRLYTLSATHENGLRLYAHKLDDGTRVWESTFHHNDLDDIKAPTYRDGHIYFVAGQTGQVYAVDDTTGTARWSTGVWADTVCSPAVTAERVILTAGHGNKLVALNRDTGDKEWSVDLGKPDGWGIHASSPVVADGTVYVGSEANRCFAIDAATGKKTWTYELDSAVTTAPAVADDVVYVSGESLHAITNTPNSPPSASIEYDPRPPVVDEPVEFRGIDSTDDGTVTTYEWDLDGDETFETSGLTTTTTFTETGEHEVALRVTDNRGATDTSRTTITVTESNETPTASFAVTPDHPITGEAMTFDASGSADPDGSIERYEWEIDDGGVTGTGPRLEHTFTEPGEHSVVLRVTDGRDATATARQTVRVLKRRASFELTAPESAVTVGKTAAVTLGVTNYLSTDPMTVQLQVDTPAGVSLASVKNADSGSGATTAVTSVAPSNRSEIPIYLTVAEAGTFDVDVTATYYVGERAARSQEVSKTATVTGVAPTTTEGRETSASGRSTSSSEGQSGGSTAHNVDGASSTVSTTGPGFGIISTVATGAGALWWTLTEDRDEDNDE